MSSRHHFCAGFQESSFCDTALARLKQKRIERTMATCESAFSPMTSRYSDARHGNGDN